MTVHDCSFCLNHSAGKEQLKKITDSW